MKEIQLTRGYVALVSDEDYNEVASLKWFVHFAKNKIYARSCERKCRYMHRLILKLNDPKIIVDHKDGDGLNNQRTNLRICTQGQNMKNSKSHDGSSSIYVGVHKRRNAQKYQKKWVAQIRVYDKTRHLGVFDTEFDAAIARDQYIITNGFEFSKLNILKRVSI